MNVASALAWAQAGHEVAVCSIGPGIVGTGTRFGHGGLAAAEAANAALALGGVPVIAVRAPTPTSVRATAALTSHRGRALARPRRGGRRGRRRRLARGVRGLPLSHMGRGPDEEPAFFAAAFAAGLAARDLAI